MEEKDIIKDNDLIDNEKPETNIDFKEIIELKQKCICKIISNDNDRDNGIGFFCNILIDDWNSMKVLMTNNNLLNKNDIIIGKKFNISINGEKEKYEIEIDEDRKVYSNEEYDITIIEIKDNDGLKLDSFLEIDNNIFKDNFEELYKNESIYLLDYPKEKEINYSNGIIKNIYEDKYTIEHTCEGSPGSPLINSTKFQLIGINKGRAKEEKNYNIGIIVKEPIEVFKNKIEIDEKNKTIHNEEINKNINKNEYINENINKIKICMNELKEGNGKYIFENGEYYIGEWLNYLGHGKGTLYYKDNKIKYEGDFIKGKFEGSGKYIWEDGNYYIGEWLNGFRHGKGTLYYKSNTIIYEGDFVKGKKEGNGKYFYENGEYYIGEWLNGLKHGKGTIYYKDNKIKYEGNFVKGEYEGIGKKYYHNGEYYIGEWLNGLRHGKGTLYNKDNKSIYEGSFAKDKFKGAGKYIWENGEYYIGEWLNDLRHGKGTIFYKDNTIKYEGDFVNDKFEGNGKYKWDNGNYYIGKFVNGSTHGKGILYDKKNTIIYEGDFVQGEYSDKCQIY